jgi:hypothetical protein
MQVEAIQDPENSLMWLSSHKAEKRKRIPKHPKPYITVDKDSANKVSSRV